MNPLPLDQTLSKNNLMEVKLTKRQSIWGKPWASFRKWFYPTWFCYETTIRFYDYSTPVYDYFISQGDNLGIHWALILAILLSCLTFIICFFFLTVPGSIALFRYFKNHTLESNSFEQKLKTFF